MNIYKVTLAEAFSTVPYSRTFGLAGNVGDAGRLAIEAEMPDEDDLEETGFELHVQSIEFIAVADFGIR